MSTSDTEAGIDAAGKGALDEGLAVDAGELGRLLEPALQRRGDAESEARDSLVLRDDWRARVRAGRLLGPLSVSEQQRIDGHRDSPFSSSPSRRCAGSSERALRGGRPCGRSPG